MAKDIAMEEFQDLSESPAPTTALASDRAVLAECQDTALSDYAPDELAEQLGCNRRTVFKYVGKLLTTWHWVDEDFFKCNGRYSQFTLDEMQRLKGCRYLTEYQMKVWRENDKPAKPALDDVESEILDSSYSTQPLPEVEVIEDESVSAIARIRQDRYAITTTGSNRLARATETRQSQRSSLLETRERVRQAFMGLAVQTQEAHEAQELEGEARFEEIFEQTYAQRLEELQVANAARDAADADFATLQERMKAHQPGNGQAAVS